MRSRVSKYVPPVLVLAWAALIFQNYFRELTVAKAVDAALAIPRGFGFVLRYLEPTPWPDVASGLLLMLAVLGGGSRLVSLLKATRKDAAEETLLAFCLGLAGFSYGTFVLALAGLLSQRLFWGIAIGLVFVTWKDLRSAMRRTHAGFRDLHLRPFEKLLTLYIAVQLLLTGLAALAPVTTFDTVVYHLTGPKLYGEAHRIIPVPDILETVFPKNAEMVYLFALKLHYEITAQFTGFLVGVLLCGWIVYLGSRYVGRTAGLGACAIVVSMPVLGFEMRSAYVDFFIALFVLGALHYARTWLDTRRTPDLVTSAVLVGFAGGMKYNALVHIGLIGAFLLWRSRQFSRVALFGVVALAGTVHWLILCYAQTGDPLFPFFSGDPLTSSLQLFDDSYWKHFNPVVAGSAAHRWGFPLTPLNAVRSFWWMHFDNWRFDGNIGPLFVLLFPFFLAGGDSTYRWYSAAYFGFWLFTGQSNRYMIPILPMAALTIVSGVAAVQLSRRTAVAAACGLGFLMLPIFYSWWHWSPQYHPSLMAQIPWRFLAGREIRNDYLRRVFWSYPAIQHVNALKPTGRALYVGFHDGPPLYYMDFQYVYNGLASYDAILGVSSVDQALALLRKHNVEYIIAEKFWARRHWLTRRDSPFQQHLDTVFDWNGSVVYRLREAAIARSPMLDFVSRPESEPHLIVPLRGYEYRIGVRSLPAQPITYRFEVVVPAVLRFGLNVMDQTFQGVARARVEVAVEGGDKESVFTTGLNRSTLDALLLWQDYSVDLSRFTGKTVTISLSSPDTELVWSEPQVHATR